MSFSRTVFDRIVTIALVIGLLIDAWVGILAIFFQPLLGPLLDVPVHDPAIAVIAGSETLVVAGVYALALREWRRFRPILWICCADQLFAAVVPAIEIARGQFAATIKTLGPIPLSLALAAIFAWGAIAVVRRVR